MGLIKCIFKVLCFESIAVCLPVFYFFLYYFFFSHDFSFPTENFNEPS